jgi:predicted phosphodiesterase
MENLFNLPLSDESYYSPYILPKVNNNILLLADIHIPYHSISALTCAIKYGKNVTVNTILLNGDIMDCYSISKFLKDPRKRSIKYELESTRQFLDVLAKEFPTAKIFWKDGNHERRYENYLKIKAPELLDIEEFRLDILLGFGARGIEKIDDDKIVMAGKLPILHGHEFSRHSGSGVKPARSALLKAKHCVIVSHLHTTSEDCKNKINGELLTAWSTGCLCELNPEYARINEWNHGFAHIKIDKNGDFNVNNKRIYKGVVL